jgi:hypothetical protein
MSSKRARPDPIAEEEAADLDLYTGRLGFAITGFKNESRAAWQRVSGPQGAASRDEKVNDNMNDGLDDDAGVGIVSETFKNDSDINNFLHQKARPVNEKLLEQLLGSKGARAKRKEMNAVKAPAVPTKPTTVAKQKEDDSDDEGGRASAITSKHGGRGLPGHTRKSAAANQNSSERPDSHAVLDDPDDEDQEGSRQAMPSKSAKRKAAGGYLDELLAAKANKKNKKKNASGAIVNAG